MCLLTIGQNKISPPVIHLAKYVSTAMTIKYTSSSEEEKKEITQTKD